MVIVVLYNTTGLSWAAGREVRGMIPPLFRSVTRYVDVCICTGFRRDPELFHQARILSGLLQLYLLMLAIVVAYLVLLAPVTTASVLWSGALCTMLGMAYITILWVLRTREAYVTCANAAILVSWLAVLTGVCLSGGPLQSPAVSALVIPVIIAFCLHGRRGGMLWANAVFIGHWLLLAIDQLLYPFPQWLDTGHRVVHHAVTWSVLYFAVTGLMLIFDSTHFKLRRERDAERQRYAFMAAHDPLTQLANRASFDREIAQALARAERQRSCFAVLCLDLDGFKLVNDRYGHAAGDTVLQGIATRLRDGLRKSDCVARMGGDEFAIILDGLGTPAEAGAFAEKIIGWVRQPFPGIGPGVRVGASIGIALYPQHASNAGQLCQFADDAMYRAKAAGQGWQLYEQARGQVRSPPEASEPAASFAPPGGVLAGGKV